MARNNYNEQHRGSDFELDGPWRFFSIRFRNISQKCAERCVEILVISASVALLAVTVSMVIAPPTDAGEV